MGNVLDELFAEVLENHSTTMTEVVVHPSRYTDLAAPDQALQPRRNIYAIAKDVALLDHDVAHVDADPEAHSPRFGFFLICLRKRFLDLDRAVHGIDYTCEFGEHAVAGRVRNPTFVPCNELVDHGTVRGQNRERSFFIAVHQAAVALDICCQDSH
jgi:hypothetical protein